MSGKWPSFETIAAALKKEAEGDAKRLGHWLYPWSGNCDGTFYAACSNCRRQVKVTPRELGTARIRGEVVTLPCAPTWGWGY